MTDSVRGAEVWLDCKPRVALLDITPKVSSSRGLRAANDLMHARVRHARSPRDGAQALPFGVGLTNGVAPLLFADELREAIPPAYTELIGHQLLQHLRA